MRITRNKKKNHELKLPQAKYIKKAFSKFNIQKSVNTPFVSYFRLSKKDFPKTEKENDYMCRVSYALTMNNLIYVMISTRPNIA